MKSFFYSVLALLLVFLLTPSGAAGAAGAAGASGARHAMLDRNGYAKVLEIIDGDSLAVEFLPTGETALIRLIGVDANGYDGAIPYLSNLILGKNVILYFDDLVPTASGRWNNMYVYKDDLLINRELVRLGYAKTNAGHKNAALYEFLAAGEEGAKQDGAGVWKASLDLFVPFGRFARGEYNINTANRAMLRELLDTALSGGRWVEGYWDDGGYYSPGYWDAGPDEVVDEYHQLIENIIYYRARNPFNTVTELKFVRDMTKEAFDKIRPLVTVSTNLMAASAKELYTLGDISWLEVNRILKYREVSKFVSKEDFFDSMLISAFVLDQIMGFVDFVNLDEIDVRIPDKTVNLNSATAEELTEIGVSAGDAERILFWQKSGYTFKSVGEIGRLLGYNMETMNAFEDNFTVSDLPFYYFDGINLNTASPEQLKEIGLNPAQVDAVSRRQGRMFDFYDIPAIPGLPDFDVKITLYTNINAASRAELSSLFPGADAALISDIASYRNDQPFGSYGEIYEIFDLRGLRGLYDAAAGFIVLR